MGLMMMMAALSTGNAERITTKATDYQRTIGH